MNGNRRASSAGRPGKRPQRALVLVALLTSACISLGETPNRSATVLPATIGDPAQGRQAIQEYGCHSCHHIPGVPGANSYVGPPLLAWAERTYIVGMLPNTPENLAAFIQYPQAFRPGAAMPNMGVTAEDAHNMSAYLYTLESQDTWNWRAALQWW